MKNSRSRCCNLRCLLYSYSMYDCRQLLQLDTLVYGKIDLYFSTEIVECVKLARNFNPIFYYLFRELAAQLFWWPWFLGN